ncbi:Gp138 family membrane-puncturing spike protein [Rouxiella badensis]|uniref:Gp138 family membrane-puncturing spike protein n=1 Tax=Rouxiella badensis TaxID=1646377 RepID=UPI00301DD536
MATVRPVSDLEVFDASIKKAKSAVNKALPGIIQSFDPLTLTCVVELAVYATRLFATSGNYADRGIEETESYPLIVDAPVIFPRGGDCTLTFPIKAGDECLVIFSDKDFDFWWQSGNVQRTASRRSHDLSDAFVIPGPRSQEKKISNISMEAVQLRSDDGRTSFSLNPASGSIAGIAPGGFDFNGLKISASGQLTLVDGSVVDGHGHGGVQQGGSRTEPLTP